MVKEDGVGRIYSLHIEEYCPRALRKSYYEITRLLSVTFGASLKIGDISRDWRQWNILIFRKRKKAESENL